MRLAAVASLALLAQALAAAQPDVVDLLATADRTTWRRVLIEREFDADIIAAAPTLIERLRDPAWASPGVRLHVANLIFTSAPLDARQALEVATRVYEQRSTYDVDCLDGLLLQLILCLPAQADPAEITRALAENGWCRPFTTEPVSLQLVERYQTYVNERRARMRGRGPNAVEPDFPFTRFSAPGKP